MKGRHHLSPFRQFKRKLRHHSRARSGTILRPSKWVFVVGCYNSGTTLLVNLLKSHDDLGVLPREGVELTDRLPRPEMFGWPRMWTTCMEHLQIPPGEENAATADRIKRQWSHFVDDVNPIVEKSPANLLRLNFLHKFFQPAYFIYIVRNGYAVAEGIQRKADLAAWGNKSLLAYDIADCARQWRLADELMDDAAPHLDNLLSLSYEQLTADVPTTMRQVSDFLEIEPFPEHLGEQKWQIHEQYSTVSNMNRKAIGNLSSGDLEAIREVAGPVLEKYGYAHD